MPHSQYIDINSSNDLRRVANMSVDTFEERYQMGASISGKEVMDIYRRASKAARMGIRSSVTKIRSAHDIAFDTPQLMRDMDRIDGGKDSVYA